MNACPFCGSSLDPGSRYCTHCGQRVAQGEKAPQAPIFSPHAPEAPGHTIHPLGYPIIPPYPADHQVEPGEETTGIPTTHPLTPVIQRMPASTENRGALAGGEDIAWLEKKKRGRRLPLIIVSVTIIVLSAALPLYFFVLTPGNGPGKADPGEGFSQETPTDAVRSLYLCLEQRDASGLLKLLPPSYRKKLKDKYGEDYRKPINSYFFKPLPQGLDIRDLELKEELNGEKATVTVISGKISYIHPSGHTVEDELLGNQSIAGGASVFNLAMKNGNWFIQINSFPGLQESLNGD